MFDWLLFVLAFASAVGSALVAGIFFAFSTFVMHALARLPTEQGIAAMQSINITVINPFFMGAFLGTGVLCALLAAGGWFRWDDVGAKIAVIASLIYLIGVIGVTIIFNVPLNDALAAAQPGTQEAIDLWTRYLKEWTFWNHVRTVAPLFSAILFILALLV
jgi:uncharacterized membrane protein